MPELPDVEGYRRVARLSGRRVKRLWRAMDEVVREWLRTGRVPPAEG